MDPSHNLRLVLEVLYLKSLHQVLGVAAYNLLYSISISLTEGNPAFILSLFFDFYEKLRF